MADKKSILSCNAITPANSSITFTIVESGEPADTYKYNYSPGGSWTVFDYTLPVTISGLTNNTTYTIDISSTYAYYYADTSVGGTLQFTATPVEISSNTVADVSDAETEISTFTTSTTQEEILTTTENAYRNITGSSTINDIQYVNNNLAESIKNASLTENQKAAALLSLVSQSNTTNFPSTSSAIFTYMPPGTNDPQTSQNILEVTLDPSNAINFITNLGANCAYTAGELQNLKIFSSSTRDVTTGLPLIVFNLDISAATLYNFQSNTDVSSATEYTVRAWSNSLTSTNYYDIKYIKNDSDRYLLRTSDNREYRIGDTDPLTFTFAGTPNNFVYNIRLLAEPGGNGSDQLPCVCEDTDIFTTKGYINVTKLKVGDKVITPDFRIVEVKDILKTSLKANSKTYPYIIQADSIAPNYPPRDTRLSRSHLIKYNNSWIKPLKNKHIFSKDTSMEEITYYHIKLENYKTDHLVVNGGFIIESFADRNNTEDIEESMERDRKSIKIYPVKNNKKYFNL